MATNPERSTEEKAADREIDQEPNDKNATIDGDITADAADRFADTIRPSWYQIDKTPGAQEDSAALEQPESNNPEVDAAVPQSGSGREDTDAELKIAAATILPVKKVRKKMLLWVGGVTACFFALIAFSVTTQKEQETSLWESDKGDKTAPAESVLEEKSAEAKSGAKAESETPTKSVAEPTASAINPSADRVEKPVLAPENNDLAASSQPADEAMSKPHPQMLLELSDELGAASSETLMVGDTTFDLEMARNAGSPAVAVLTGAQQREELLDCAPLECLPSVGELPAWLSGA